MRGGLVVEAEGVMQPAGDWATICGPYEMLTVYPIK